MRGTGARKTRAFSVACRRACGLSRVYTRTRESVSWSIAGVKVFLWPGSCVTGAFTGRAKPGLTFNVDEAEEAFDL